MLLLLTRGGGTQGRRHPVVIITEALSAQRHTRPRSTALDSRPREFFLTRFRLERPEENKTPLQALPELALGPPEGRVVEERR